MGDNLWSHEGNSQTGHRMRAPSLLSNDTRVIFQQNCISLLGTVVWGHHMYTVGLETDTRGE